MIHDLPQEVASSAERAFDAERAQAQAAPTDHGPTVAMREYSAQDVMPKAYAVRSGTWLQWKEHYGTWRL